MPMRRPAAAPKSSVMRRPAALPPAAFFLEAWTKSLDLEKKLDAASNVNTVYLVTCAMVLASTLASRPDLEDPASFDREEIRRAFCDAFEEPMTLNRGGRPRSQDGALLVLK